MILFGKRWILIALKALDTYCFESA